MTLAEQIYAGFDDLVPVGRRLEDPDAMTLVTFLRDEMYFLPAFLAHYRRQGIERFVMVDDRSTDGSRELLLDQPDVMVLGTRWRYGEVGPLAPSRRVKQRSSRTKDAWLNLLSARYGLGRWTARADLDEFIVLPAEMKFRDAAARAEANGGGAVFGPMLDLYPERLDPSVAPGSFDPGAGWFYDALPHIRLRGRHAPRQIYHGARARLLVANGIWPHPALRALLRLARISRPPFFSDLRKPVLFRWEPDALHLDSHRVTLPAVPGMMLPVLHYKFAEDIARRIRVAVREKQYASGSFHYSMLQRLIDDLAGSGAPMTCAESKPLGAFDGFVASGNACMRRVNKLDDGAGDF